MAIVLENEFEGRGIDLDFIDFSNFLFLYFVDYFGMVFVFIFFNGFGFVFWKRSMVIVLFVNNKIIFVNGCVIKFVDNSLDFR